MADYGAILQQLLSHPLYQGAPQQAQSPMSGLSSPLMSLAQAAGQKTPAAPLPPANPGVPTPLGDPTGGAGPAFLGGTSPLGGFFGMK